MIFEEIANKFNSLIKEKTKSAKESIIELLRHILLNDEFSTEQKIFAYWNISDNYALLKNHNNTYKNHVKFEGFLRNKDEKYKLMLICDATQKLSLVLGRYEKYWNSLYFDIVNNCDITEENYIIYFQALRTALYFNDSISEYETVGNHALSKMKDFLNMYANDTQYPWFEMIYYECLIKYNHHFSINNEVILEKSYSCFKKLSEHLKANDYAKMQSVNEYEAALFGTYESWNSLKPIYIQARCVQNYIITLINCGYNDLAKTCCEIVGDNEFNSPYFKKKVEFLYKRNTFNKR